jgi:hypothetical protein
VTEPAETLTLRDRILGMGLSEERADEHLAAKRVRVGDEYVSDGNQLVTRDTKVVFVSN